MRTLRALAALFVAAGLAVPLAGCSGGEPLTADNIRQRVADAMREAQTFRFDWTSPGAESEPVTYTGKIRYGEQGQLKALEVSAKEVGTYRLVKGTLYHQPPGGMFQKVTGDEKSDIIKSWDYAQAIESFPAPTKMSKEGEEEIHDVSTTRYVLTPKEGGTLTWWITDGDRLVREVRTGNDGRSEGTITDYGEPIEFPAMGD